MEMTKDEFDTAIGKAAEEKATEKVDALRKELDEKIMKVREAEEVKKTALRAEFQESYEAARRESEAKGLPEEPPAIKLGKLVTVFATARGDLGHMSKIASSMYPEDKEVGGYIKKTLEAGTPSAGGFGIPNVLSSRVIDILYANTFIEKIGVPKIPMPNGNVRLVRMNTATSVGYVGEIPSEGLTEPAFGDVDLSAKKMFALCELSNSLLKYNAVGIESWVVRELQRRAMLLVNSRVLYGSGTAYSPLGLANNGVQTIGSSSTALAQTHPDEIIAMVKQADVPLTRGAWVMSPKMESWLKLLKTTDSHWIFRDEMVRDGKLCGYPYFTTTISSYTDTTTDYADLWFGDWDEFLFGVGREMELQMSQDAAYVTSGTTRSAFQRDTTLVKLVAEHDFNVMHAGAFVRGTFSVA